VNGASVVKRASALVGDLMSPAARKTRARPEGGTKKGRFYRTLPTRFRRNSFEYRQLARKGDIALYEQVWSGCAEPSPSYEVIRIRRREGFRISGRFVEPAEIYPPSELWGANGFTFADTNKAWDKFFEISLEGPARTGREVI
jgi:hypothetical protein